VIGLGFGCVIGPPGKSVAPTGLFSAFLESKYPKRPKGPHAAADSGDTNSVLRYQDRRSNQSHLNHQDKAASAD
jgi:hypothetical protein